ncbi:MAG: FIG00995295: hypothetical protein [uncultured Solirubrobacteraceae bacterium]|uniref:Nucleotidyltransferase family protein n=1 Tax=uncultured Solirubrobacteraceae bacterium TaxID=1162706 RepID=A0A6J4RPS5_9ACTN|nr:MAG: FIG00995295: hypothetical protein [uncultured Solirubrobacteraceae bacterium]
MVAVHLAAVPVHAQAAAFERMVMRNPTVAAVVERMPALALPGCYLAAGALFQTVWNCLTGRDPEAGIRDYDLDYFDGGDLSWEAEDRVIQRADALFADLGATVEVRNEARVHLWYEERFGVPCPPYTSTEAAIASFPSTSACFGIRPSPSGLEIFAPYGFADVFSMRTRPNPVLAPRWVYEAKVARWRAEWPELDVLPWPEVDTIEHEAREARSRRVDG